MGLFDRLLGLFGGGGDGYERSVDSAVESSDSGRTRGSDAGAKSGSHGSHWETLVEGVTHEMTVDGLIPLANSVEAQFRGQLGPAELDFFPTNFFAESDDAFGGERRAELAALAYDCVPAEAETICDESGEELGTDVPEVGDLVASVLWLQECVE